MKSITTLVDDIYKVLEDGIEVDEKQLEELGHSLALLLKEKLGEYKQSPNTLRMSQLGTTCLRKLWYKINTPEAASKFEGKVKLKLLYGHILEHLVLWLAEVSGHEVKGTQNEVEINGVKGHSDAFIDGVLVDVKSANSRSFQKFEKHSLEEDDPFGYLDQVNAYLFANQDNPDLKVKKQFAFLAVDKELGNLKIDTYPSNGVDYSAKVEELKLMLSQPKPPKRDHMPQPDGKGGNMKLIPPCSYCEFKQTCYPELRTFIYSNGPRFLTHTEIIPKVPELIYDEKSKSNRTETRHIDDYKRITE